MPSEVDCVNKYLHFRNDKNIFILHLLFKTV